MAFSEFNTETSLMKEEPFEVIPTDEVTHTEAPIPDEGGAKQQELCGDFQRGRCFRSVCKFAHVYRNVDSLGEGGMPASRPPPRGDMQAEACKDYMRGRCMRGRYCRYTHGSDYAPFEAPPPFAVYPPHHPPHPAPYNYYPNPMNMNPYYSPQGYMRRRKETCRDFLNGRCTRGDSCRYLHKKEVCGDFLRGDCQRTECRYSHSKADGEKCLDYQRGICKRGESCRYYHDDVEQVCRDFLSDRCTRGDGCKFTHDHEELAKKRKLEQPEVSTEVGTETELAQEGIHGNDRPSKMIKS